MGKRSFLLEGVVAAALAVCLFVGTPALRAQQVQPTGPSVQPGRKIEQKTAKLAPQPVRHIQGMPRGYNPYSAVSAQLAKKAKADEATVTLSVAERFYYYYSIGAQLLMDDGSGSAYARLRAAWELEAEDYERFQYFIPEKASCDHPEGSYVPVGSSASLNVPAGGYDIMVADVSDNLEYTTSCGFADTAPLQLTAGHNFLFEVHQGYYLVYEQANCDVALTALLSHGVSEINLTREESLTIEGVNGGMREISSFRLTCVSDGGTDSVTELVDMKVGSGEYFTYTFKHKFDLSAKGEHKLVFKAELEGDEFPENNILNAVVWHVEPRPLPYFCAFSEEDEIAKNWLVDDANRDGNSWRVEKYNDEGDRAAFIHTAVIDARSPEALTMFRPLHLEPGPHHISFYISTAYWYAEDFDVLYGTASHTDKLQVLKEFRDILTDNRFILYHVNFTIGQAGDYFFAISARHGEDPYRFFMNNLSVDTGFFKGQPDLKLEQVFAPLSSCALGEREELKVRVSNYGYKDVEVVRFSGKISYSGVADTVYIDTVLQVNLKIQEANREVSLGFYDFSLEKDYTVELEVACGSGEGEDEETETETGNNAAQRNILHWTPLEIPFVSDFTGDRPGDAYWTYASGWTQSPNGNNLLNEDTVPVYSRCINLKGGALYRLTMTFACGVFYYYAFLDDFVILYGKPGTDLRSWDTISYVKDGYTGNVFITRSVDFSPEEDGAYSLAIICTTPEGSFGTFVISYIEINEVADYDVDLLYLGDLPSQVPVEHINNKFALPVQVANKGRKGFENAKVEIFLGETKVGEASSGILNAGSETSFYVELDVNGLSTGDEAVFTAVASVPGHEDEDLTPERNTLSVRTHVSDDVLAYDFVTDSMCREPNHYVGSQVPLHFAMPLYVMADDTLTGVSVFWGEGETYETMVAVIRYENGLRDIVYYNYYRKEAGAGEQIFEMPALLLESGIYVISVQVKAVDLVVDRTPEGSYYYIDGDLYGIAGSGWAGIRGRFGHDGHPMARDAAVYGIQRPDHDAPLAENQTVVFEAGNNGFEPVDAVFTLFIDGVQAGERTLKLQPYERGTETLTGDLSAVGTHTVTVRCFVEGDEDDNNNEVSVQVRTLPSVDPYVMNFEDCEDFSVFDFNPNWVSVDMDGAFSPGYADIPDFPHMFEAFGFMAFNGGVLGITEPLGPVACEGERFGASFYSSSGQNNDWLVSPCLTLPLQNAALKFTARSLVVRDKKEKFNVLVSDAPDWDSFILLEENVEAPYEWTPFTVDLSAYAGKNVYLAVQCVSENAGMFMIDNIEVSKPAVVEGSPLAVQLRLYPNPASDVITVSSFGAVIEQVEILSVSGCELYTSRRVTDNVFRYSVKNLVPGLYLAKIKTSQGVSVMKFVVK